MSKVVESGVGGGEAAGRPEVSGELQIALADIAAAAREGLLAVSVAVGCGSWPR